MNEIKPLTIEETALKEEMKRRCLNKGQYIDEKAEDKFKMLCHLEDFEIQYWELKGNWNELKDWLVEMINEIKTNDVYDRTEYECTQIATLESTLAKVEELESRK